MAAEDEHGYESRVCRQVLGAFEGFVPATVAARRLPAPPIFERHVALDLSLPPHLALASANPGWEDVTVHAFSLRADLARPLNRRLRALALELERAGDGLNVSNVGAFHSRPLASDTPRALAKLRNAAARAARAAHADEQGARVDRPRRPSSLWCNVSRGDHYHGLHDHAGAVWSGCYYPARVPAAARAGAWSGRIAFRTAVGGLPDGLLPAGATGRPCAVDPDRPEGWCAYATVEPAPGLMLVWPSWLLHCVLPVGAIDGAFPPRPRVSYSFNFGES
ncbi:hypothetical protein KFE25_011465 [Diacronema lutheri]|uniref:Uncharacterized protein n=1 Tax=Diacronema lutheri TaxID=2081491 RepID=A0A8J5XKW6_DIALT|nr:hypothetical protein KFE25_011465 [Diacronema lutheri]